jgi:hypothetical protein
MSASRRAARSALAAASSWPRATNSATMTSLRGRCASDSPIRSRASSEGDDEDRALLLRGSALLSRLQRRILPQHGALELLERRTRLDPQLLDQGRPRGLVRSKRLGLPAGVVEREHQLPPETLTQRVLGDEVLELAHELGVAAELEIGVDPLLEREDT